MSTTMLTAWEISGDVYHSYGWYHWMWIGITVIATFLAVKLLAKKHSRKTEDIFVLCCGLLLVAIEIYKQVFHLKLNQWEYPAYLIPYQFCSAPMYVMVIAPLLKYGKLKDSLYNFLGFYALLAGISVMAWPESCLNTTYITMLIHTMLWHCLMVVVGIFLIASRRLGRDFRFEINTGSAVFMSYTFIAVLLNETVGFNVDGFNLFYLSYHGGSVLPVLSSIYNGQGDVLRWVMMVACYLLAFEAGTIGEFYAVRSIRKLRAGRDLKNAKHKYHKAA